MWVAFLLFLIWKLVDGVFIQEVIHLVEGVFYVGFLLLVAWYMAAGEKWLMKKIFKEELEMIREEALKEAADEDIIREAQKRSIELLKKRMDEDGN